MTKTKVFISRELGLDSPFKNLLDLDKIEITDKSLIDFSPMGFSDVKSEWIFFYSKTGVKFYLRNKDKMPHPRIATFGPATAEYFYSKTGQHVDYIGRGIRYDVAKMFSKQENFQSCLFVVGKNSLRSIQKILREESHQEVVVYNNTPKKSFVIDNPAVAVFTSPMAVKCYYDKYNSRNHANISIGESTAKALQEARKEVTMVAKIPTEKYLVQALISYLDKSVI